MEKCSDARMNGCVFGRLWGTNSVGDLAGNMKGSAVHGFLGEGRPGRCTMRAKELYRSTHQIEKSSSVVLPCPLLTEP